MKFFGMAKSVISSSPFFHIQGVIYKQYAEELIKKSRILYQFNSHPGRSFV
jgi:hypothetical protein